MKLFYSFYMFDIIINKFYHRFYYLFNIIYNFFVFVLINNSDILVYKFLIGDNYRLCKIQPRMVLSRSFRCLEMIRIFMTYFSPKWYTYQVSMLFNKKT